MERNYELDEQKITVAYNALRDFYNAPSGNDNKELDILWNAKMNMNSDELMVFYNLVQIAYCEGRQDGWKSALTDEDKYE